MLTIDQKYNLDKFSKNCITKVLSTDRINRYKNQELINFLYEKYLKIKKKPTIHYVDSPVQYYSINKKNIKNNLDSIVNKNIKENLFSKIWAIIEKDFDNDVIDRVGNSLKDVDAVLNILVTIGQCLVRNNGIDINIFRSLINIYWIGFYIAMMEYFDAYYKDMKNDILLLYELSQNVGYIFFYKDVCFISERPTEIHLKQMVLHNDTKPAVIFADGKLLWFLNGVNVPEWLVQTSSDQINPKRILIEKNVEVRKEMLKKLGVDRIVKELNCKIIDNEGTYELLKVPIGNDNFAHYLKMINPSTNNIHFECVPLECDTVSKSLAWRCYEDTYKEPYILT